MAAIQANQFFKNREGFIFVFGKLSAEELLKCQGNSNCGWWMKGLETENPLVSSE